VWLNLLFGFSSAGAAPSAGASVVVVVDCCPRNPLLPPPKCGGLLDAGADDEVLDTDGPSVTVPRDGRLAGPRVRYLPRPGTAAGGAAVVVVVVVVVGASVDQRQKKMTFSFRDVDVRIFSSRERVIPTFPFATPKSARRHCERYLTSSCCSGSCGCRRG